MDRSGGEAELHVILKNHYLIITRQNFVIFIDIFLPKSKPIFVGMLYRPPDKPEFIEYLESSFFNFQKRLSDRSL